jgi:hypothetical protein
MFLPENFQNLSFKDVSHAAAKDFWNNFDYLGFDSKVSVFSLTMDKIYDKSEIIICTLYFIFPFIRFLKTKLLLNCISYLCIRLIFFLFEIVLQQS